MTPGTQDPADARGPGENQELVRVKDPGSGSGSGSGSGEVEEGPGREGGPQEAPDGGWGWVVLSGTLLVLALTLGFPSCMGIFYTDLQAEFHASNTQTSWVPGLMIAMLHAGGPLCSVLVERFGCQVTVMAGGLLSGLSLASGCWARSITDLHLTSALTGLGFSLSLYPSVTMVGQYFVRRRVLANALASTGTAVGYSAMPLVADRLRAHLGWRGSFLVLGGVLLNCCVCGAVMRPVAAAVVAPRGRRAPGCGADPAWWPRTSRLVASLRRHLAYDLLLANARYRAFAVGVAWVMLGFLLPQVYLVPYATAHRVERDRAALLMSVIGLVSIATRPVSALLLGLLGLRGGAGVSYAFAATLVVNGLSDSLCAACPWFGALLGYVVVYGVSQGLMGSMIYSVLMALVDREDFPPALGLVSLLQGAALLVGPPLAGMLLDATGQYSYVFHACNAAVTSGGLFLLASFLYFNTRTDAGLTKDPPNKAPAGLSEGPVTGC